MIGAFILLALLAAGCKLAASFCFAMDRRQRGEKLLPALHDEVEKARRAGL